MRTSTRAGLFVLGVASAAWLGGCANFTPPSKVEEIDVTKGHWITYDASRRGTIVAPDGVKMKSCAEPAPDVALTLLTALKGNFALPSGAAASGVDISASATAMALAGRDDVVLLARESLYRICEMNMNGTIADKDVANMFVTVFVKVVEVAKERAVVAKSNADAASAVAQKAATELKLQQLQQPLKNKPAEQ